MACEPITPAGFKTAKPQFAAVDDAVVASYIALAQVWASGDWPSSVCFGVQVSVVCHLMTLDGLGSDQASMDFASGHSSMQSIKSSNVTFVRFRSAAQSAGMSTTDWFGQTPCGRQFMVYVRMFMSGPRWASAADPAGFTAYAKDGWWLC